MSGDTSRGVGPTITVLEPRRRGRPKAKEPGSALTVWVPTSYHDRIVKMASERRMSVSSLVRQMVTFQLRRS